MLALLSSSIGNPRYLRLFDLVTKLEAHNFMSGWATRLEPSHFGDDECTSTQDIPQIPHFRDPASCMEDPVS
jgi:hypothetical protein